MCVTSFCFRHWSERTSFLPPSLPPSLLPSLPQAAVTLVFHSPGRWIWLLLLHPFLSRELSPCSSSNNNKSNSNSSCSSSRTTNTSTSSNNINNNNNSRSSSPPLSRPGAFFSFALLLPYRCPFPPSLPPLSFQSPTHAIRLSLSLPPSLPPSLLHHQHHQAPACAFLLLND